MSSTPSLKRAIAEVRARVAARLVEFGQHVLYGDGAEALVGISLRPQRTQHVALAHHIRERLADRCQQALDERIGFGMHTGAVERVVAVLDAQKAGAQLEGLGAQPVHVQQLLAAAECAVRIAPAHDVAGHRAAQAGDAREQRRRGGVQIDADRVHAILDDSIQAFARPL